MGNIMFVKGAQNVKKPLLIHVDICSKFVTGIPLRDRTEVEYTNALKEMKAVYPTWYGTKAKSCRTKSWTSRSNYEADQRKARVTKAGV